MIVGTAGHIDHGKTSLVRSLTGTDTDRLKQERERGITIELGFAYWPRPDGEVVGFVDVPGHERLVHTMLAGATGIDLVLLAIAADDGVMPQTREHLAILDLLGLGRGAVVLTKHDLVDAARSAAVQAEIRASVAGTGLAGAPILPVSTLTGEGIAGLKDWLDAARAALPKRSTAGRFRLAVDRVFSLPGAGTVVTGTVLSGSVAAGDAVMVSPAGLPARVRSIHAQNRAAERGEAGQRCALALVGPRIDKAAINRGDVVLDPTLHAPTQRVDVRLRLLDEEPRPLRQWAPVRFHHGAKEAAGRVVLLRDGDLAPGQEEVVQLVLDAPMALAAQDRFVLRETSASRTIGGGVLLDLRAPERHRRTALRLAELAALQEADPALALQRLLAAGRGWVDLDAFLRDRALPAAAQPRLVQQAGLILIGPRPATAMATAGWQAFARHLAETLDSFHATHPEQPGLGAERLRLSLRPRLPAPIFAQALEKLRAEGSVLLDRAWVRRPGHEVRFTEEEEALWQALAATLGGAQRFRPPRVRDLALARALDEAQVRRLFRMAARRGDVDELEQDHYFLSATVVEMAAIARDLAAASVDGRFSVIAFRDRLENGRKVAIQVLEFFDRHGLTMRRGDYRRINPHKATLFASSMQEA